MTINSFTIRLTGLLWLLLNAWGGTVFAQSCLPEGLIFSTQAQIDAFAADYPGCSRILGDVMIEEAVDGDITNLRGLAGITSFGDYLEIHDNEALEDLRGLEAVVTIDGGLNIFGNPALKDLSGLEGLTTVTGSLRIALNHELRNIEQLKQLRTVGEDLTVSDNQILPSLHGMEALDTIGGYMILLFNGNLLNLRGLDAVRGIGKGLLVEDNAKLQNLRGLEKVGRIGGNCVIVNNDRLRTLEGLESLTSIGGNLQIAVNPFLEEVRSLKNLTRINGLLQIYENVGLKSLSGLDSIDPAGIQDLAILSCDILTICHVKSICDYFGIAANQGSVSLNGFGCNFRAQILERCRRKGSGGRPARPKDPVFFPNPTSGIVEIEAENIEDASLIVVDGFGRILIEEQLATKKFDLSDLAAGMYFVRLKTEDTEIVQKIVKLN